jgi:hypothetical protein
MHSRCAQPINLWLALLLAGCAAAPTTSAPVTAGDCDGLKASLAATEGERRAAIDKQQGAWKAVIPVLVAVRYAQGKAETAQADQRQTELQRELDARGCTKG